MPDRGFVGPNALRAFLVTSLFVSAPTVSEAAQAVAEPSAALLQEFAERLEGRVAAAASGSYDCAGRQFAGYEVTGDIGQWIDGHVFRWRELQAADGRRCIEVTKPFQKFLTEDEASTLLSVSAYGLRSQTRRNAADTVPGGAPAIIADPTGPAPAAAEADGRLRGDVFGPDTRVRVADTTAAPWRYVTFIEFDTAGRRNVGCTGVLISPYAALTAAHCLYNKTDGDAVSPRVFPAITTAAGAGNVPIIPYGGRWGAGVDRLPNWAINPIAYRYDLAVVYVAQPFTQFTTFTPIDYQAVVTNEMHSPAVSLGRPQNLTMGSLTVVGYSGDAVRGETPLYPTMWVSLSSATTSTDLYNIFHDADRSAREAGAPILGASAFGVYRLVGIHSNSHSSTTTNVGTRLNTLHRSYIEAWAAWRPSTSNAPQSGWWWSVSESGRGYGIEVAGGRAFIGAYMYDADGSPVWYVSSGAMTSSTTYSGQLDEYRGGQTLFGPWRAASLAATKGTISLSFSSSTAGTLTLPNGANVAIRRYDIVTGGVSAGPRLGRPASGWWWNASEGGRGYFLEVQGTSDTLFLATYMYDTDGTAVWYAALGDLMPSTFATGTFSARLYEYRGGQTLTGPWQSPSTAIDRGQISISFSSTTSAILTLPGGTQIPITRFTF